jgi:Tfp pilus assembly protein PilF
MPLRRKSVSLITVSLWVFIVYLNSLKVPFVLDDFHLIVDNPYIKQVRFLPWLLGSSSSGQGLPTSSMYRPFLMLTFFFNYTFGRLGVFGYHLTNIIIHITNVVIFYLLIEALFKDRVKAASGLAFFSALVFGVHPVNSQAVIYISSRSELLLGLFSVGCLYLFLQAADSRRQTASYVGSLMCFALALLSKETAIVLPIVILVYDLLFIRPGFKELLWRLKRYYLGYLLIAVTYSVLRSYILGGFLGALYRIPLERNLYVNILTQITVIALGYLRLLLLPWGLSIEHHVEPVRSFGEPRFLLSLAVIMSLLLLALRISKSNRQLSFFILWFFIWLLPTSILPLHIVMSEHRLYLGSACFALWLSYCLRQGLWRFPKLSSFVLVSLAVTFSDLTINRNLIWQDELRLWQEATQVSAYSSNAHYGLAMAYLKGGNYLKAAEELNQVIALSPNHAPAHSALGLVYSQIGKDELALKEHRKAISLAGDIWELHNNLGLFYLKQGNYQLAADSFREAIKINPLAFRAYNNLGLAFKNLGRYLDSLSCYLKALEIEPGHPSVYNNIAVVYSLLGDFKSAEHWFKRAIRLDPQAKGARLAEENLERLMRRLKQDNRDVH